MDISIGILAGGKSNRFGLNKATINLNGKSIISNQILEILNLSFISKIILISVRNEQQINEIISAISNDLSEKNIYCQIYDDRIKLTNNVKIKNFELKFIIDQVPKNYLFNDTRAAIFGLYSLFNYIKKGYVQIIPCDMPFFKAEIMKIIFEKIINYNKISKRICDALIPKWNNGHVEPLNSIYLVETYLERIKYNIENGIFKLTKILSQNDCVIYFEIEKELNNIDPQFNSFLNINQYSDLEKIHKEDG